MPTPEMVADEAEKLLAHGFRAVKLRLGYATLAEDRATVRAVRRRIGDDVALMVDYNQALDESEAGARGRMLEAEDVYWLEEPIRHDDYAGNARLKRALTTPIQLGENFSLPSSMQAALAADAASYVMPDLERIGGVTGWLRASALAQAHGVRVSSHIFPEISAQLLCLTPTAHWLEYADWWNPVLERPLEVRDGMAVVDGSVGTGVGWDETAVGRYSA